MELGLGQGENEVGEVVQGALVLAKALRQLHGERARRDAPRELMVSLKLNPLGARAVAELAEAAKDCGPGLRLLM